MRGIAAVLTAAPALLLAVPATAHAGPRRSAAAASGTRPAARAARSLRRPRRAHRLPDRGTRLRRRHVDPLYGGNAVLVGPVVATGAAGGFTLVKVTNTAAWHLVGWIPLGADRLVVLGSTETPVGGSVCLVDRALGLRCGTVTAKNQTVHFAGGSVSGLTRTAVCLSPGTGVAFVTGGQAQGCRSAVPAAA